MTNIKIANYDLIGSGFSDMDMSKYEKQNKKGLKRLKDTKLDIWWSKLSHNHPYIAFVLFLVGLPLSSLLAVAGSATFFILPLALLLGWL